MIRKKALLRSCSAALSTVPRMQSEAATIRETIVTEIAITDCVVSQMRLTRLWLAVVRSSSGVVCEGNLSSGLPATGAGTVALAATGVITIVPAAIGIPGSTASVGVGVGSFIGYYRFWRWLVVVFLEMVFVNLLGFRCLPYVLRTHRERGHVLKIFPG